MRLISISGERVHQHKSNALEIATPDTQNPSLCWVPFCLPFWSLAATFYLSFSRLFTCIFLHVLIPFLQHFRRVSRWIVQYKCISDCVLFPTAKQWHPSKILSLDVKCPLNSCPHYTALSYNGSPPRKLSRTTWVQWQRGGRKIEAVNSWTVCKGWVLSLVEIGIKKKIKLNYLYMKRCFLVSNYTICINHSTVGSMWLVKKSSFQICCFFLINHKTNQQSCKCGLCGSNSK